MLKRELKEEAGLTIITCVKGPTFANGSNYFHVCTDQTPADKDAVVVGLTL